MEEDKKEDGITGMMYQTSEEQPGVDIFRLSYKSPDNFKLEHLGKKGWESKLKCGERGIETDYGTDYDCDYEFAGEISCEECIANDGEFDPRYSRESQEIKTIPTVSDENMNNIIAGMNREIDELKRKVKVMENQLYETIGLCRDMVGNLESLWRR